MKHLLNVPRRSAISVPSRLFAARIAAFVFTMVATLSTLGAEVVFDVNFNELHPAEINTIKTWNCPQQFPRNLPNGSIVDDGASAEILSSVGDLTDTPVLLKGAADALSSLSFDNPVQFESGIWTVSWDSMVTSLPAGDKNRANISATTTTADGRVWVIWNLKNTLEPLHLPAWYLTLFIGVFHFYEWVQVDSPLRLMGKMTNKK